MLALQPVRGGVRLVFARRPVVKSTAAYTPAPDAAPPSINISPLSFLYLTVHCLGLFGRILLYQEFVLLAIVLRVRCSSDHGLRVWL